jgi:hypothetical protein
MTATSAWRETTRVVKTQNGVRMSGRWGGGTAELDTNDDPTPIVGRQSIDRTFALNFGDRF